MTALLPYRYFLAEACMQELGWPAALIVIATIAGVVAMAWVMRR